MGLDLKNPEGRSLLLKLMETADVFLTNMRPDALAGLALGVEELRAINPKLIYVRGTGQGVRGPDALKGGFDGSSFWARTTAGIHSTVDDAYPAPQPGPAWGDLQGGLTIAGGIAAALFHRERTGEPSVIDNSLMANGMWAGSASLMASDLFGIDQMPAAVRGAIPNPLIGFYRCSDGRFLMLMLLQADRWWPDFADHLGRPDLKDHPKYTTAALRSEHKEEFTLLLEEIFVFADSGRVASRPRGRRRRVGSGGDSRRAARGPSGARQWLRAAGHVRRRHHILDDPLPSTVRRDPARPRSRSQPWRAHR